MLTEDIMIASHIKPTDADSIVTAQILINHQKKTLSPQSTAQDISSAAWLLFNTNGFETSADYHTAIADIIAIGWKRNDVRDDVCDLMSPETRNVGIKSFDRLLDINVANSKSALTVFIDNKAAQEQRQLDHNFNAYVLAL